MIIKRNYNGISLKFSLDDTTYKPDKFTRLMAKSIVIGISELAIDVGTGSGALAIMAKKLGASKVIAVDIVTDFKRVFEKNCILNHVDIKFKKSNLLNNIKKADVIIANLAQTPFPKKIRDSVWGGPDGTDQLRKIIYQSHKKLNKNGRLYLGVVSLANPKRVKSLLYKHFKVRTINEMRRYISPKIANKWQPGFYNYLLSQQKKGLSFIYKDGKKRYYKFYVYEAIK